MSCLEYSHCIRRYVPRGSPKPGGSYRYTVVLEREDASGASALDQKLYDQP